MDLDLDWQFVADTVMGGVSSGQITRETVVGRDAVRLTGEVSLENDGGFVQMASDLGSGGRLDASGFKGIAIDVIGNGETYDIRLRTEDLSRPWQSYRVSFTAPADWTTLRFDFSDFERNNTDIPFDTGKLRRVGILAVGSVMTADVAVSAVRAY